MNIKSLANNLSSIESIGHTKIREVKSEQGSADRDADGRRHQQEEPRKESFNQEELCELLEKIRKTPGFKESNLRVRLDTSKDVAVFHIEDAFGKIIRRMTAPEVWMATRMAEEPKGKLVNRSA